MEAGGDGPTQSDLGPADAGSTLLDRRPPDALPASRFRPFIDSWKDIHVLLTFDYSITDVATVASKYDFVWGADSSNVSAYRGANPAIFLSSYIPCCRDPNKSSLSYWQASHPDWIVYQCDKTTPAYLFGDANVPLDVTNPAVVAWQVTSFGVPAMNAGYDAIAADNYSPFWNGGGACGVWHGGSWVPQYSGSSSDPAWTSALIGWAQAFSDGLHALGRPMALVPNFDTASLPSSDSRIQQIVAAIDGDLSEAGFTNYGGGHVNAADFVNIVDEMEYVQKEGKSYYSVNQVPSSPPSIADIQWSLSAYLMGKEHAASIYITSGQYGAALWYPELDARIGHPCAAMAASQHVYMRDYSTGLAITNPDRTSSYTVALPSGASFQDLYGSTVGPTVMLAPSSGLVLVTSTARCL